MIKLDNIKIGDYIKNKRKELNLTQGELALKLDVSHQAVSRWEKGDNLPDVIKLSELASLFNITIDEIINNPNESNDTQKIDKQSSLSFYKYVNGAFSSIALILYYILLLATLTLWIPVLAQYIIILGISFIYIIPYAMTSNKTIDDFKQVRYSILCSIGSLMLSANTFFIPYLRGDLIFGYFLIGLIATGLLLYILNTLLEHYEYNTFQSSSTGKRLKNKTKKRINLIISYSGFLLIASIIIGLTGFFTDLFYMSDSMETISEHRVDLVLANSFGFVLIVFTILSIIISFLKIMKQRNILNIVILMYYIGITVFYIIYSSYTNIGISQATGNTIELMIVYYGISFFLLFLIIFFTEIYLYIKDKMKFKINLPTTAFLVGNISLLALIQTISTSTTSLYFIQNGTGYETTIHNKFEYSLIPLAIYLTLIMYVSYNYIQASKKERVIVVNSEITVKGN